MAPKAVLSVCYPVLIRGVPNPLFEKADKMLWIFEPEFVRDLADRFAMVKNAFFGDIIKGKKAEKADVEVKKWLNKIGLDGK